MNQIILLFFLISNPLYAENLPGEWVGSNPLTESPVLKGNILSNPATADTSAFMRICSYSSYDDFEDVKIHLSSILVSIPILPGFSVGGGIKVLYNAEIYGDTAFSNDWDSFREYLEIKGGIDQYSMFLEKSLGALSLGVDLNILNGEVEKRWEIDFDKYDDINDTLSVYFRGYSAGVGFVYQLKDFSVGGYCSIYHTLESWKDEEEKEGFPLKRPFRFGISYSPDKKKSINLSVDRKTALLTGRYGPFSIGYGRIYGSGYDLGIEANRFVGGISISLLNRLPVRISVENRRYLGKFEDNEYIGSIMIDFFGVEGGKE
ncbi:hypothetical protein KAW18_00250 [candidate division WOR-3 bacterium]|nr:hypothetical protein [candidate division WOR-3 bacterium]MCK4525770.1 hypothetical protein [candidate division WOR-3 bacterium]